MVPIAGSVENATTAFGTAAPLASVRVALTTAGEPLEIEVTGTPDELTSERTIVPAVEVVTPVGIVGVAESSPLPPQLANRAVIAASIKADKILV
jgi:hypothetical protein